MNCGEERLLARTIEECAHGNDARMWRSGSDISAILARQSASASALFPLAFRSLISSFVAAFSFRFAGGRLRPAA